MCILEADILPANTLRRLPSLCDGSLAGGVARDAGTADCRCSACPAMNASASSITSCQSIWSRFRAELTKLNPVIDGHSYEDPRNGQPSATVLVRGQKQLLLSKSLIDGAHWDKMKDFKVFSYISPASKKVVGSQLIFELSASHVLLASPSSMSVFSMHGVGWSKNVSDTHLPKRVYDCWSKLLANNLKKSL